MPRLWTSIIGGFVVWVVTERFLDQDGTHLEPKPVVKAEQSSPGEVVESEVGPPHAEITTRRMLFVIPREKSLWVRNKQDKRLLATMATDIFGAGFELEHQAVSPDLGEDELLSRQPIPTLRQLRQEAD